MSRHEYERLLTEFHQLAVHAGSRSFELLWHNVVGSGAELVFQLDGHGGWTKVEWRGATAEHPPFDAAQRVVVCQLSMPLDDKAEEFASGLDPVTMPRGGVAADTVTVQDGDLQRSVSFGQRFRDLAAEAGSLLAPVLRDALVGYCPEINTAPACWWYALLFAMSGQTATRLDGGAVEHERELIVYRPLLCSVDAIQRFRLNTDNPGLPEGASSVLETEPAGEPQRGVAGDAEPDNLFRHDGSVYRVRFEGEVGSIDSRFKGARIISELLQHPNIQYSATELHVLGAAIDSDVLSRRSSGSISARNQGLPQQDTGWTDLEADREALRKYSDRLAEIKQELTRAKEENSTVEIDMLNKEKQQILDEVRSMKGLGAKLRQRNPAEKHRSSVAKAIGRVLKKCRHSWNLPKLADHLEAHIDCGASCAYRPPDPLPDWHF